MYLILSIFVKIYDPLFVCFLICGIKPFEIICLRLLIHLNQVIVLFILLDEPVSNSGRLKTLTADIGEEFAFGLDIQILRDVDRSLYGRENVITSDSVILDHCASWVNLAAECMKETGAQSLRLWD